MEATDLMAKGELKPVPEQFETQMTKGIAADWRKLKDPLMGELARERSTHFTRHERNELYAYLKARAEKAQ